MKDPDLLRDTLEDAIPPGLAEAALHALTRAARQRRLRSRASAIAVPVLALAAGIVFLPRPASAPPAARSIAAHASPPIAPPSVEYLTDEQLLSLFAPELGVVLAGPPEDRRLLVVARNPRSDTP